MRIGIVTFYHVANYGAMLQAYALWHYLERRGHAVEFLDIIRCNMRRMPLLRCFWARHITDIPVRLKQYIEYSITSFAEKFPQTRRFADFNDLKNNCPKYDAIVVGSDQMWNPTWCAQSSIPFVFLEFSPVGCKRISYAASFAVKSWFHEGSRAIVGRLLNEFEGISVRETSGVEIVKSLSGREAMVMPDPTLLWNSNFYDGLCNNESIATHPYVFKYFLEWTDGALEEECVSAIRKNLNIQIERSDRDDKRSILYFRRKISVKSWLKRIAASSFVVTNSFHGTVFSILFRRPFVTVLLRGRMAGMNERVYTLLSALGLEDRMVDSVEGAKCCAKRPIDWSQVNEKINLLRSSADSYWSDLGL